MVNAVKITVVDSMMGMGKTSAAIGYMEKNSGAKRFLFITPYLDEGDRIINSCPSCKFMKPQSYGSKIVGIKTLLRSCENIVSTHALFGLFDRECMELIQAGGYTLIMDEVYDAVAPYDIEVGDYVLLRKSGAVSLHDNGILSWDMPDEYSGVFNKVQSDFQCKQLVAVGGDDDGDVSDERIFEILPTASFACFESVIILTYMFDGSILKSYFDFYEFSYEYIGVRNHDGEYEFSDEISAPTVVGLADRIHIWAPKKYDKCFGGHSLSYSWFYSRNKDSPDIMELKKSMQNFFINGAGTKSKQSLWTTYKHARQKVAAYGYARSFESHNARATNKYRDRSAVAYAVNKYMNPCVLDFFRLKGVTVDQDQYALSSMVQFIWRSAIRDGHEISLYIPSLRMRRLFENWLKEVST